MKPAVVTVGLLALVACVVAGSDHEMLIAEMRKQEGVVDVNKTIGDLAHDIVREGRAAWHDVVAFVKDAVEEPKKSARSGRAMEESEGIDVAELLKQLEDIYGDRQSRSEEDANEVEEKDGAGGGRRKAGGAIVSKPVLIPIPGPPGPPGPPGVPGLPGIPGKSPNLKGLKAILLARLAKVLLLIKALLVLCLGLSGGMYGATLGLVLPIYGKFKKAGVVVPVDEEEPSYGYEQPAYQPAYGQPPAGPYNRRNGDAGSFAPMARSFIENIQNQVSSALDKGKATFEKNFS